MDPRVVGQLRMERRDEDVAVAQQHRLAVELGEHLDARRRPRATRGARMKTPRNGSLSPSKVEVGLEARDLAPVGVPLDLEVDAARGASRSSRIIPAQVPKIGRRNARIASSRP